MSIAHTGLCVVGLLTAILAVGPASGQNGTPAAPSPIAPGDLSKPAFDTTKPVYDFTAGTKAAAATVVAEVEGRAITLGDVSDAVRELPYSLAQSPFEAVYPIVLEQLVRRAALVVRAQQQGVDEEPMVRRRVRAAAETTLADEYAGREIQKTVTEAALLERYNRDIANHPGPEEVRPRIIMVRTEEAAQALIAEIQGGADFATVARRASVDTTAAAGGDVGFQPREGMSPEISAVAFSLPPGHMAPYPVSSLKAWFVVKVEERRRDPVPTFAAVREQLTQRLLREGVEPFINASMKDLQIRRYSFMGKVAEPEKLELH